MSTDLRAPGAPRVSFIVLSYNYEQYIAETIQSILDQTFQDLEIVVVDDASRDRSRDVIRSFDDPRVRLHVNERNLGGAASYNVAVSLARGELLVNLDADDWIDPRKTDLQLAELARDPTLDVVGTYVAFVGDDGQPHARAAELEGYTNQPHDMNLVETWTVQNMLCRSSTMMRRSVHDRIGLDDPAMVRAPDFELWTRALRAGCRFHVIPEKLTYLRLHDKGVTHADPRGSFREISWIIVKNLAPLIEQRAVWLTLSRAVGWMTSHEQFASMPAPERYRLLGAVLTSPRIGDYAAFERFLSTPDAAVETAGRRMLALIRNDASRFYVGKLEDDVSLYTMTRQYFRALSERLSVEASSGPDPKTRVAAAAAGRAVNVARSIHRFGREAAAKAVDQRRRWRGDGGE